MDMIFGHDDALAQWVAKQIPHMTNGFGPCKSIGVGDIKKDRIFAAVVYHNYVTQKSGYATCEVSIAAATPIWARRGIIRALLSVPFEQYKVSKVYSMMTHDNERAIRFNKGIGFRQEATLRHHFGEGKHAMVTSMLEREYQRIYGDGRVLTKTNVVRFPVEKACASEPLSA